MRCRERDLCTGSWGMKTEWSRGCVDLHRLTPASFSPYSLPPLSSLSFLLSPLPFTLHELALMNQQTSSQLHLHPKVHCDISDYSVLNWTAAALKPMWGFIQFELVSGSATAFSFHANSGAQLCQCPPGDTVWKYLCFLTIPATAPGFSVQLWQRWRLFSEQAPAVVDGWWIVQWASGVENKHSVLM